MLKKLMCLATAFAFAVCLSASAGETFKIGAFLQLSGGNSAYGVEARNAAIIAIDEINAAGGLNGQQIEFIPYDTQGSPEEAIKIAARLIDIDKVSVVIGSVNSNEVLAAAKYLDDAKVPTFGLGNSPTWMAQGWKYVYRPASNHALSTALIAGMAKTLGMKRLATFKGQDDSSLATGNSFIENAKKMGLEITADESYDAGDTDYSAQVANIIDSEPHGVFLAVVGETGPVIVKQLRQQGYTGIIFFKESFMVAQVEIAGKAAATDILFANPYVTYTSIEDIDIPEVKEFNIKYQKYYGHPAKTDSAYRGWDAVQSIAEAARIAGANDSASIQAAMPKVKIPGLGGTLDYSEWNEGYGEKFNTFAFIDQVNILFEKWLAQGGYEAYKKKTGNEY